MAPWSWILGGAVALGAAYLGFRLLPQAAGGLERLGAAAEGGLGSIGGSIVDFFRGGGGTEPNTPNLDDTGGSDYGDYLSGGGGGASGGYPTFCDANPELCQQQAADQSMEPAGAPSEALIEEYGRETNIIEDRLRTELLRYTGRSNAPTPAQQRAAADAYDARNEILRSAAQAGYIGNPVTDFDYYDPDGEAMDVLDDPAPEPEDTAPVYDYDAARERAFGSRPIPTYGGLGSPGHQAGSLPAGIQEAIDRVRSNQDRINSILSAAVRRGEVQGIDEVVQRRANIINRDETIARIYASPDNSDNPVGLQSADELRAGLAFLQSPAGRGLVGTGGIRDRAIARRQYQLYRLGESDFNPYQNSRDPR